MSSTKLDRFTGTVAGFISEVERRLSVEADGDQLLPIGTARHGFSPVLHIHWLLERRPDLDRILISSQEAQDAEEVLVLLGRIASGSVTDEGGLRRLLDSGAGGRRRRNRSSLIFDLLYGALQLSAAEQETGCETLETMRAVDALDYVAGLARGVLDARAEADAHVTHFMVHAASFLCSRAGIGWADFEELVQDQLDAWGEDPTDSVIIRHAVFNLGIDVDGRRLDDREYDSIREGRRAIRQGTDAPTVMSNWCRDLSWSRADRLAQILAPELRQSLHEHVRTTVEAQPGDRRDVTARELGYIDCLGRPLLRGVRSVDRVRLQFPGGSAIGRSCLLYEGAGRRVAVDFGGVDHRRIPSWTPELTDLDAVLITHAHHDHIGGILALYEQLGYQGSWYADPVTIRCVELAIEDSLKLQQAVDSDEERDKARLAHLMSKAREIPRGGEFDIGDLRVRALPSGHVPGSVQFLFEAKTGTGTHRTLVSGDVNPGRCLSVDPLELPSFEIRAAVDVLVVEGTNAYRSDAIVDGPTGGEALRNAIRDQVRSPVLVPTMSLGRAQEIIAALGETEWKVGVFGLAARMTAAIGAPLPSNITLVSTKAKRTRREEYDVLVASAGCLQGGPSRAFWESEWNPPVILTGYLFPGTPAHALQHDFPIVRFSGHASAADWRAYVDAFPAAEKFLVHYPGSRPTARRDAFTVPRPGGIYEFEAKRNRTPARVGRKPIDTRN